MRARRALLYMPGDDLHKIRKATTLGVDCICMDLEDSVTPDRKADARATIAEALQSLDFGCAEKLVRINPPGCGLEGEDLRVVLPFHPQGIVIPKIKEGEQIRWVSAQIAAIENERGWTRGAISLIAIIETARAILDLREIASADSRIQALICGADDLAVDIGATRTREGWEVFYARSAVVMHAAAFGLQAIDIVFTDLTDPQGLRAEASQGAQMGFAGKQIIHPSQVTPVQEAFTPSDEAVAHARRIVEAYQAQTTAGAGAFTLDGKMVDAPIVRAAERTLEKAKAGTKTQG
jgi:citrate lyase beta subunit